MNLSTIYAGYIAPLATIGVNNSPVTGEVVELLIQIVIAVTSLVAIFRRDRTK